jgi:hypothetical protein
LQSKWANYDDFAWGTQKDYQTIGPALVQLYNAQQSADAVNRAGATSLASQLDQYQSILNSTKSQIAGLKMKTLPDNQLLSALNTYVSDSTANVTQTKADLAAKKSASVIYGDITATAAIAGTYSAAEDAAMNASNDTAKQLDPTNSISALVSALSTLSAHVR